MSKLFDAIYRISENVYQRRTEEGMLINRWYYLQHPAYEENATANINRNKKTA
jgi:hypothetical protein